MPDEVAQVWAEVLTLYETEPLYLDPALTEVAQAQQREAMEADDREGMVREYLEKLLPDNWRELDLFARRNYLCGDFGNPATGTVRRERVCPQEIWAECFGKNPSDLRNKDSSEINAIMVKMDGWGKLKTPRNFKPYGNCRGFTRQLQAEENL